MGEGTCDGWRLDDLRELKEGTRPAMREDKRHGVVSLAALVDEGHSEAVESGAEVSEAIELFLLLSPVESALPVPDQLFEVGEVRTVVPARAGGDFIRPAGASEAFSQVIEDPLGNPHLKRPDVHVGALCHVQRKGTFRPGQLGIETRSNSKNPINKVCGRTMADPHAALLTREHRRSVLRNPSRRQHTLPPTLYELKTP